MKVLRTFLLMAVVLSAGCRLEGLAFERDERVQIVSPGYRDMVDEPVTVDWEVTDAALADRIGDDIDFGVFVDVDPQPPGESLEYFARDDPVCERSPGCPDAKYLRQRGIHMTSETEITFAHLPIAPGVDLERGHADWHEVSLVLLDENGIRMGESAWPIIFEIERDPS